MDSPAKVCKSLRNFEVKTMSMEILAEYFKPESRKSGEDYFHKDLVYLSIAADTQVQALVKAGTGARVHLKSKAISAPEIEARCSCPIFAKGTFCKHIWATILATEQKHPDFLESKTQMAAATVEEAPAVSERKAKQSEFKKAQSERLKEKNKQQRLEKKKLKRSESKFQTTYPPEVQAAIDYFDQNGFSLKDSMDEESIQVAKRKLSRVFHPDKGGTHEEILELNRNAEVLLKNLD